MSLVDKLNSIIEGILIEAKGDLNPKGSNLSSFLRTKAKVPYVVYKVKGRGKLEYMVFFFKFEEEKEGVHWKLEDGQYTFIKQEVTVPSMQIDSNRLEKFIADLGEITKVENVDKESLKGEQVFSGQHPVGMIIRKMRSGKTLGVISVDELKSGVDLEIKRLIEKRFTDDLDDADEPTDKPVRAKPAKPARVKPVKPTAKPARAKPAKPAKAKPTAKPAKAKPAKKVKKAVVSKKAKTARAKSAQKVKSAPFPKTRVVLPNEEQTEKLLKAYKGRFEKADPPVPMPITEDEALFLISLGCDRLPNNDATEVEVFVGGDPLAGPLVKFKAKNGKPQSGYSSQYSKASSDAKFAKIITDVVPNLEAFKARFVEVAEDEASSPLDRTGAIVGLIVQETGLRPGTKMGGANSEGDTFGISSLLKKHVKLKTTTAGKEFVELTFVGKALKENKTLVRDPFNVEAIKEAMKGLRPNDPLFVRERMMPTTISKRAGDIMSEVVGGTSLKDLRTAKASQLAIKDLEKRLPKTLPKDIEEAKEVIVKAWSESTLKISEVLCNTQSMTAKSYVAPSVLEEAIRARGLDPRDIYEEFEEFSDLFYTIESSEMRQPSDEEDENYDPSIGYVTHEDGYPLPSWLNTEALSMEFSAPLRQRASIDEDIEALVSELLGD